jgi:hypothetical protein
MNETKSSSGWKYFTKINPNYEKPTDPLSKAFDIFLNDLLIDKDSLEELLKTNTYNIKKFIINTNGEFNNIIIKNYFNNQSVFYKNRFLQNRKFKQKLIDYYNSFGIFVNGPTEKIRSDGTSTNIWVIELNKINKV